MDRPNGLSPRPAPIKSTESNGMPLPSGVNGEAHRSSLVPLARPDDRRRESTQDSVDQAEGIFDLYERDRDSWRAAPPHATKENGQEELADPASPVSWEGPMSALARPIGNGSRRSSINPPPNILITPDKTHLAGRNSHRDSSMSVSTSTSTSLAASPTHPSMSRLTPRHSISANGSASTSRVSIAASSQYPGEDNDAFHVRSTCQLHGLSRCS